MRQARRLTALHRGIHPGASSIGRCGAGAGF